MPFILYFSHSPSLVTGLTGLNCDMNKNIGVVFSIKIVVACAPCHPYASYFLSVVLISDFNKMNPVHQQAQLFSVKCRSVPMLLISCRSVLMLFITHLEVSDVKIL